MSLQEWKCHIGTFSLANSASAVQIEIFSPRGPDVGRFEEVSSGAFDSFRRNSESVAYDSCPGRSFERCIAEDYIWRFGCQLGQAGLVEIVRGPEVSQFRELATLTS
jgi:hypothetical protein